MLTPGDGRNGSHQRPGIAVTGVLQHLADRARFQDAPTVHHHHTVRSLGNDAHVVGDEHGRQPPLTAETPQQRDDLRLHRNIQCGGGFVGNQQAGVGTQRQGNGHTLTHAAGELVRILGEPPLGLRDLDFGQQGKRPFGGLPLGQRQVGANGLGELLPDGEHRVEAGERILKDHADASATQATDGLALQRIDAHTFQRDATVCQPTRRLDESGNGQTGHRFSGTGFTDHTENFARCNLERDLVQHLVRAAVGVEDDIERIGDQQGFRGVCHGHLSAGGGRGRRAASHPPG